MLPAIIVENLDFLDLSKELYNVSHRNGVKRCQPSMFEALKKLCYIGQIIFLFKFLEVRKKLYTYFKSKPRNVFFKEIFENQSTFPLVSSRLILVKKSEVHSKGHD